MQTFDRSKIGLRLPAIRAAVNADEIRAFAAAIGETDAVHFDDAAARARGYRAVTAPPTFAFTLKMRHQSEAPEHLLWSVLGTDGAGITLLHAEQGFSFTGSICAGDVLTFEEHIADIYLKKGGALTFVALETAVTNQHGERVATFKHTEVARSSV